MMKKIVSKSLPVEVASKYLRDVFRVGGVCETNSEFYMLGPKTLSAIVPEDAENARLIDFVHGGILEPAPKVSDGKTSVQRVHSTVSIAAEILSEQLFLCKDPQLWIHEPLLTEEELVERNLPHVHIDGVIYLVYADDFVLNRVKELIQYSKLSWHFLAFVIDGKGKQASIAELCQKAKFVLIGAYDGESFLYLR